MGGKIIMNIDKLIDELIELEMWFKSYYTIHEQKYRRLYSLNKADDDGANAYDKLMALYNEAETKRARIQQLEALING